MTPVDSGGTVSLSLDEKLALTEGLGVNARRIVRETGWLVRPLVATTHAVLRLGSWLHQGGLDRSAPDRDQLRAGVAMFGDAQMLDPVLDALQAMAPPARDYVLARAAIIATGWSTHGWTAGALTQARAEVIVLSGSSRDGTKVRRTMLHESSHVWLEPPPSDEYPSGALAATDWHLPLNAIRDSPERRAVALVEARAEALTAVWNERWRTR